MTPIVLDTNVISELARPHPDPAIVRYLRDVSKRSFITTVVLAEILLGVELLPDGKRKRTLQHFAETVRDSYRERTIPLSSDVAANYAQGVAALRSAGRTISVNDAYIAAATVTSGALLCTLTTGDFEGYPGLTLVNPQTK